MHITCDLAFGGIILVQVHKMGNLMLCLLVSNKSTQKKKNKKNPQKTKTMNRVDTKVQ